MTTETTTGQEPAAGSAGEAHRAECYRMRAEFDDPPDRGRTNHLERLAYTLAA